MKILLFLIIAILFLTKTNIENFALSKDDIPDMIKRKMELHNNDAKTCPINLKPKKIGKQPICELRTDIPKEDTNKMEKEVVIDNTITNKKIDNLSILINKSSQNEINEIKKVNDGIKELHKRPIVRYPSTTDNGSMYKYIIIFMIIIFVGIGIYFLFMTEEPKDIHGPEYMEMSFEEASKIAKKNLLKKYLATIKKPEVE
jgi:hypothetical protein